MIRSWNKTGGRCFAASLTAAIVFFLQAPLAANDNAKDDALAKRYEGLGKDAVAVMPELEQSHERVIAMYAQLRDAYGQMAKLRTTFGTRERATAERDAKSMERKLSRAHEDFTKEIQDVLEPFNERWNKLKERQMRAEASMDISDVKKFQKQQNQIKGLRDELLAMERIVNAFREMQLVIDKLRADMPDRFSNLRLGRGYKSAAKAEEFEAVLDSLYNFKDYEADVARMSALKGTDKWNSRIDSQLSRMTDRLEKSRAEYLDEISEMRTDWSEDRDDLQDDIDKIQERMQGASDRRKSRYQTELVQMEETMESLVKRLEVLDKLENMAVTKEVQNK